MSEFEAEVEARAKRMMFKNSWSGVEALTRCKNLVRQAQGRSIKASLTPLSFRPFVCLKRR
jgi:hypothetical protein